MTATVAQNSFWAFVVGFGHILAEGGPEAGESKGMQGSAWEKSAR